MHREWILYILRSWSIKVININWNLRGIKLNSKVKSRIMQLETRMMFYLYRVSSQMFQRMKSYLLSQVRRQNRNRRTYRWRRRRIDCYAVSNYYSKHKIKSIRSQIIIRKLINQNLWKKKRVIISMVLTCQYKS